MTIGQVRKRIRELETFALANPSVADALGVQNELRELRKRLETAGWYK